MNHYFHPPIGKLGVEHVPKKMPMKLKTRPTNDHLQHAHKYWDGRPTNGFYQHESLLGLVQTMAKLQEEKRLDQ